MHQIREEQKKAFLNDYFGKNKYEVQPLLADASLRSYDRIISGQSSLILMNSPPEYYSLSSFTDIANFLKKHGFSTPKLYKEDHLEGFLLLEDFGSLNLNSYLNTINSAVDKLKIYQLIIDLLCEFQQLLPPPYLPAYGKQQLLTDLEVYTDWYLECGSFESSTQNDKNELNQIWGHILDNLPDLGECLLHRDFHVDNLMLLSREGTKAIGLLDFQDAKIGSPLYDLASLLEDARTDVEPSFAQLCLDYYLQKNSHLNKAQAYLAFNILAAQRNSRVLGIFMRKYKRDKQANFLQYMPRVEKYLQNNLQHQIFKELKIWLQNKQIIKNKN